jgi:hypothetical protein
MKPGKFGWVGIVLAALVVVAAIFYAFASGKIVFVPQGSAVVLPSSGTVFIQVQRMNRLETVSYTIESTYKYDQNANSPWYDVRKYLSDQRKLFVVPGHVTAGVDLSKLTKEDVQIHGKAITLNLPPSQVLDTSLDEQNIQVYDISTGIASFFQNMDPNVQDKILAAAKVSLQKDACDQGILRQASQNAQQQFTSFLTELGFTSVTVNAPVGTC